MSPDDQISPHFKRGEFACKNGCGFMDPAAELVASLELLREIVNQPIIIDDACRCQKHNAEVGGCQHSQHVLGTAADIRVVGMPAKELYEYAVKVPHFNGFGVSQGEYIHVDTRDYPAKWSYNAEGKEIPWAV